MGEERGESVMELCVQGEVVLCVKASKYKNARPLAEKLRENY